VIRLNKPGFRPSPELTVDAEWFQARQSEAGPDEILMEHNFTLARASLRAVPRPDGSIEISWPADANEVVLEGTATLPATTWVPVSAPITTVDTERRVTVDPTDAVRFFRLRAP
jgi:hypothetical protein